MKKTLTILALMIAVAGAGQVYNSEVRPFPVGIYYDSLQKPKYDTIPIVYLYCDTAVLYRDSIGNKEVEVGRKYFTYWDFGYEVTERGDWYRRKFYLDRDKQPIRKSIIIWDTRPR